MIFAAKVGLAALGALAVSRHNAATSKIPAGGSGAQSTVYAGGGAGSSGALSGKAARSIPARGLIVSTEPVTASINAPAGSVTNPGVGMSINFGAVGNSALTGAQIGGRGGVQGGVIGGLVGGIAGLLSQIFGESGVVSVPSASSVAVDTTGGMSGVVTDTAAAGMAVPGVSFGTVTSLDSVPVAVDSSGSGGSIALSVTDSQSAPSVSGPAGDTGGGNSAGSPDGEY